jgi:hypothetical protein
MADSEGSSVMVRIFHGDVLAPSPDESGEEHAAVRVTYEAAARTVRAT